MKHLFLSSTLLLSFITASAQTVTWSPEVIEPKEKNYYTKMEFPGFDAGNYFVNESEAGGVTFKRRWTDYMLKIDKATLKKVKETNISQELPGDGKEYYNARNFFMANKRFSIFMELKAQDVYDVYASIQNTDGGNATPITAIQKIDISKNKPFASASSPMANDLGKSMSIYYSIFYINQIKPAYDKKSIISAFIYQTVDKENSMLNISEWDENLKATTSNNYKIPFWARQGKQKTIFGDMPTSGGNFAQVIDFAKDPNGFFYVLVQSPDPAKKDDNNLIWLYQFKLSDPTYTKVFRKEIYNNTNSFMPRLYQDEATGKVYVYNVGREAENPDKADDYWYTNKAFIAELGPNGELDVITNKLLAPEMMYNFEKQKDVDKRNGVHELTINSIFPTSDGHYVVWERQEMSHGLSGSAEYSNYGNILVQYYNKQHKLLWEKALYKNQQQREDNIMGSYAGVKVFLADNNLHVFYPDDPGNAAKDITDRDVEKFSVVKFGNKDLAGIFLASFTPQGNVTRKYLNWPDDKKGFALSMPSLQYAGNNEFIGTARRISQGAVTLKSLEYTFFKVKLP